MKASSDLMNAAAGYMRRKMYWIMDATTVTEMRKREFKPFYDYDACATGFDTFYDSRISPRVLEAFESNCDVECYDSEDIDSLQEVTREWTRWEWERRVYDDDTYLTEESW